MGIFDGLSKREREILEIAFRLGETTAREIQEALPEEASYSAVRTFLSNLEAKGKMGHRQDGLKYLWFPVGTSESEGSIAIRETAKTFFGGSRTRAIAALLGSDDAPLTKEEYRSLRELIAQAEKKAR
jgi:predicted transcriptional regulator